VDAFLGKNISNRLENGIRVSCLQTRENFEQESVGAKKAENPSVLDTARHDGSFGTRVLEMPHTTTEITKKNPMQRSGRIFYSRIGLAFYGNGHDRNTATPGFLQNEEREPAAAGNESDGLPTIHQLRIQKK
jgi:hypothetical protein